MQKNGRKKEAHEKIRGARGDGEMSGKQVLAKSPSAVHGKHCVQFVFALYCARVSTYCTKSTQLAGEKGK